MRTFALCCFVALAGCTCERLPPGGGPVVVTPHAGDLGAGARLGGGYQGARWGSHRAEVKRILVGKIARETPDALELALGGGAVTLRFGDRDELVAAIYSPPPQASDPAPLVAAMQQKFGAPNRTPPDAAVAAQRWIWSDGETQVAIDSHHSDGKMQTEVRYERLASAPMQGNPDSRH